MMLWCRVEEDGGGVSRVNVMHPNGEILLSYPPDHFAAELVGKMRAGQIRASLSSAGEDGRRRLTLEDEAGGVVLEEWIKRNGAPERPV